MKTVRWYVSGRPSRDPSGMGSHFRVPRGTDEKGLVEQQSVLVWCHSHITC